ncbi:hypothetical protein [Limnobacter sp.]|uniref:hypothetical protein n=1 Tax=Limnobacter sp. TaxID=2003368 RepID=UPI00391AF486
MEIRAIFEKIDGGGQGRAVWEVMDLPYACRPEEMVIALSCVVSDLRIPCKCLCGKESTLIKRAEQKSGDLTNSLYSTQSACADCNRGLLIDAGKIHRDGLHADRSVRIHHARGELELQAKLDELGKKYWPGENAGVVKIFGGGRH